MSETDLLRKAVFEWFREYLGEFPQAKLTEISWAKFGVWELGCLNDSQLAHLAGFFKDQALKARGEAICESCFELTDYGRDYCESCAREVMRADDGDRERGIERDERSAS